MCIGMGKSSKVSTTMIATKKQPEIQTPTIADANVTKTSEATRKNARQNSSQDIKTTSRGLGDEAPTKKKSLLGE